MKHLLPTLSAGALLFAATSTQAALVFSEDFEGYGNTDDNTVATYDKQPPLPTNWTRASNGFGSDKIGLNLVGTNTVLSTRYTNSGLTTNDGVIGTLTAGETYTISFDVSLDGTADPFLVGLVTFADGAARNSVNGSIADGTSAVLASTSGSWSGTEWTAGGGAIVSGSTITFTYTADGTEGSLGDDLAVRIDGASTSANIDNVSVDVVPEPGSLALMGLGGLMMLKRRRR